MIKKTKRGFTLVELLATLAVLSIVVSIVVFSASGVINRAREKSYETTINNVLVAGGNYTVENPELSEWEECTSGNCEYQCVSINELISNGYFKGDILESEVSKNVNIKEVDTVYIERDKTSKAITNKKFENEKTAEADRKCTVSAYGAITFNVSPSTWTREKTVTITYTLNSNQDINNTVAEYEFTGVNGQKIVEKNITFDSTRVKSVTVKQAITENGTLTAKIGTFEKKLYISTIDRDVPTITKYESKHNLANNQTVSITLKDNDSGIKGYYFGKENPYTSTVTYESVANLKEVNLTKEVDSAGTWYLRTVDAAGNYNVYSNDLSVLEFFETKLVVDNHATVKPARILDVADNSKTYTLPQKGSGVTVDKGYRFIGWYTGQNCTGTKVDSVRTDTNRSLYACIKQEYTVTFDSNGGSSVASQTVVSGGTVSKPSDPTRSGYTFKGWYLNGSAYNFSTSVTGNITLVAQWEKNITYYTVTFDSNGGSSVANQTVVSGGTVSKPSDPTRSGYTFKGWYLNGSAYNFSSKVTSNITLKAEWTKNQTAPTYYTVTFDSNGGSSVSSKTVASGGTVSKPSDPTRSGYTFKGWYLNGSTYNFSSKVTSNITLVAQWEQEYSCTDTCDSGYVLVSGKCCPTTHATLSGSYCVKNGSTLSGGVCYRKMYLSGYQWGRIPDTSKDPTCAGLGGSYKFDSYPAGSDKKVKDKNCSSFLENPMEHIFNSCWYYEYMNCKSTTISDCAVSSKNPVCK